MPVLAFLGSALEWLANTWVGKLIITEVIGRLTSYVKTQIEAARKKRDIEKKAKDSVEPLKQAKTAEEIDNAADKALDNF